MTLSLRFHAPCLLFDVFGLSFVNELERLYQLFLLSLELDQYNIVHLIKFFEYRVLDQVRNLLLNIGQPVAHHADHLK